jgi:CRISPR-associated exonuclease Cas4
MELIPLSALNHFLYCPRRAALIHVEGIFRENQHTILGELAHEHADLPGYEVAKGVTLLRALPVWSERLGLSGKCDVVERHADGTLAPVEYKKGKRRAFQNDDAQLCAQAICLEEMFGRPIERGAVFHAASKRRREVEFTTELRALVERSLAELRGLLDPQPSPGGPSSGEAPISLPGPLNPQRAPPAVFRPACEECSLFEICLPKAASEDSRAGRLARQLFQT